jgi:lipoprotein-releasing system permease protein
LSVGLLLSLLLCLLQQYFRFIPLPSVYIIPYLPVQVHFLDVMVIAVSGLILIYFGSFYPSWRVSKLAPLEAIQYEK